MTLLIKMKPIHTTFFLIGLSGVNAENCLFMGHSFLAPVASRIPNFAIGLNHTQTIYSRGGRLGIPSSLWKNVGDRINIQAILDEGDIDLLGMTIDYNLTELSVADTDYYELWFDYALSKNPNTKLMIGINWPDFPTSYTTANYTSFLRSRIPSPEFSNVFQQLRAKYPNSGIIINPYGLGVVELRLLFEENELPDISSVTGDRQTSIFRDEKGHGGDLTLDFLSLFFINRIYNVDLRTLNVNMGYSTDLKAVAQSVLDAYDNNDFCGNSPCYIETPICCQALIATCLACQKGQSLHEFCEAFPNTSGCTVNPPPASHTFTQKEIKDWFKINNCCTNPYCELTITNKNGSFTLVGNYLP